MTPHQHEKLIDRWRAAELKRDAALPGSPQWTSADAEAKAFREMYRDAAAPGSGSAATDSTYRDSAVDGVGGGLGVLGGE